MPTKDYFIPDADSTATQGPGVEVTPGVSDVYLKRAHGFAPADVVRVQYCQLPELIAVLSAIAAERGLEVAR